MSKNDDMYIRFNEAYDIPDKLPEEKKKELKERFNKLSKEKKINTGRVTALMTSLSLDSSVAFISVLENMDKGEYKWFNKLPEERKESAKKVAGILAGLSFDLFALLGRATIEMSKNIDSSLSKKQKEHPKIEKYLGYY